MDRGFTKMDSDNKTFKSGFVKVFGIGDSLHLKIRKKFGLSKNIRIKDLNNELKNKITNYVENNIAYGSDLRQNIIKNKENLIKKRCYRGIRLKHGLPCRGQRTHTNAKTAKRRNK